MWKGPVSPSDLPPSPQVWSLTPPFVEKSIFKDRNNLYSWSHFKNKWNSFIIHAIAPPLVSEHFATCVFSMIFQVGTLLYWSMLAACSVGPGTVVVCARYLSPTWAQITRQGVFTYLSPHQPLDSTSADKVFSPVLTQLKLTPCNFSLSLQILQPATCHPIISTHCLC